jgi:hypothetical protein
VLAGIDVRDDLLAARLLELAVQVGREEGQQSAALVGGNGFVELAELELLAEILTRTEDQPGDGDLLESGELAHLRVALTLELA